MNSRKNHNKKLMLPVLIFLVGCLVLTVVLYHSYRSNYMPQHMQNDYRMT